MSEEPEECCPICGGDCASANPPVSSCPMRKKRRRRRTGSEEYFDDAWGGAAEDRMTYNLGDGSRRVTAKRGHD